MDVYGLGALKRALSCLEPPHEEDRERQRRATVLHIGLLTSAGIITALDLATGPLYSDRVSAVVANLTFGSLLLACLAGLWLLRHGHLDAVAIGLPGAIWVSLTSAAWWMDGLHGAGVFMYPAIVLMAGFLVSARSAVAFAALCSLSGLCLGLAGDYGLRPEAAPVPTLRLWMTLTTSLVVAAAVVWLVLGSLRAALQEAESSKRKFEDLFNDVPDGIVSLGPTGCIISINRAAEGLLGVRADEATGRRVADVLPASDESLDAFEGAIAGQSKGPALVQLHPKTGNPNWVELNSRSHTTPNGARHVELTVRDVTERVRAEKEHRDLESQLGESRHLESVGRLAGGVAHDFNNLLTVIQGNSELLTEEGAHTDFRERIAEVQDAAQQAAALTSQLLAFARRQVLDPEWIDLDEVVRRTEPILTRLTGEGIELSFELDDPELGSIRADPTQLQQVLINLVINARDAMPNGGHIHIDTIRARSDEHASKFVLESGSVGWARLRVRDEGVGMDDETRVSIFEPFFTTKEMGRGTGLGLASVFGTVQQSGGHVRVESRVGQGSSFSVYLPDYGKRPTGSEQAAAPPQLTGSESILLVEDESPVCRASRQMLKRAGAA